MPKELLLYSGIYDFTAQRLISEINDNMDTDVTIRVNTPGGSVFSGWGIIAKMQEHKNVTIKVDGVSASMGGFMLCYAKSVEALEVSKIMLHRAEGYTETPEEIALLNAINVDLKEGLKSKVNEDKFLEITGITVDDLFDAEIRKDVWLSAEQAKEIGLVNKINKLKTSEVEAFYNIAASYIPTPEKPKTNIKMTLEEFKATHPEVFAEALSIGAKNEQERIQNWTAFSSIDAEAVEKGIESGKNPTSADFKTFAEKLKVTADVESLENGSAKPVATATVEKPTAETEISKFEAEMRTKLGLNNSK